MGFLDNLIDGAKIAINTWEKKGIPKPEDISKSSKDVEKILKDKK